MTGRLIGHIKFELNLEPLPSQLANTHPMSSFTPQDIRRRANDYDFQIRQGLEDGTIRSVLKTLGTDLVSRKNLFVLICSDSDFRQRS